MFVTLALLATSGLAVAALEPNPNSALNDSWAVQADGLERAKQAIQQCLTSAGEGPDLPAHSCIRAAYRPASVNMAPVSAT